MKKSKQTIAGIVAATLLLSGCGAASTGGFEIKVGEYVQLVTGDTYSGEMTEYVRIPIEISNTTDSQASISEENITFWGDDSKADESVMSKFSDGSGLTSKIKANGDIKCAIYMPYVSNGTYCAEISGTEIKVEYTKPTQSTDMSCFDIVENESIKKYVIDFVTELNCSEYSCTTNNGALSITVTPIVSCGQNSDSATTLYFGRKNAFDNFATNIYCCGADKLYSKVCLTLNNSISETGEQTSITFESAF